MRNIYSPHLLRGSEEAGAPVGVMDLSNCRTFRMSNTPVLQHSIAHEGAMDEDVCIHMGWLIDLSLLP
jgi:hypothetical protein